MRFNEMLEGTRADLSVKVFGDDNDRLEQLGGQVLNVLKRLPGTAQAEYEVDGRTPSLVRRFGLAGVQRLPPLKARFMAEARGETGKLPALLRGNGLLNRRFTQGAKMYFAKDGLLR